MTRLKGSDLVALGFMTFALFLGAGNIIFPASAGMASGDNIWPVALGFLLTGVGLPLLTIVALARVGGGMPSLTGPLGKVAGTVLAVAVYLSIGPLFATPRTAVVSFEIGVAPFTGNSDWALFIYSLVFFGLVLFLVLNPGRLIDRLARSSPRCCCWPWCCWVPPRSSRRPARWGALPWSTAMCPCCRASCRAT